MKVRPLIAVFGCFLIYLGLGTTLLFGNITPYLTSYLKKRVNNNTRYEQTAWIIYTSDCLTSFFFCGVWLAERIGHRFSILIGTVIFSLGKIATYWTIQHSLGATIATLGMVVNVGYIGCYGFPLSVAMQWFPNNKGLVAGIVSSGMAFTPVVMNNLHTYFINPNNLQPDADGYFSDSGILDRVPFLFVIMGAVQGSILLIGLLLYQEPPSDITEETEVDKCSALGQRELDCGHKTRTLTFQEDSPVMSERNSTNQKVEKSQIPIQREFGVVPKEALKMKEFYILLMTCIGSLHSATFICNFYKIYGQTFINDDTFLTTTGSASGCVHVVFRVLMGLIQDKISFKPTSVIFMGLRTILLFTLVATSHGGQVMFIIWICALYATFPVEFVCIPAAVVEVFGKKHTSMIYGMIYFVAGTSVIFWPIVFEKIIPSFGWFGTFCLFGSISFIGFLASLVYSEKRNTLR